MKEKLTMRTGADVKKPTRKEIEAGTPFIRPEDCPGAVIDWVVKRDETRDKRENERDKALVKLMEQTIDKLFEKHFKKYITMIFSNRIMIIATALVLGALWAVVLAHIYT